MKLDRTMIYLNAAFLAALGIGFAIKGSPLPAYAQGKPWEALASERLLGMTIGGVGLALWFLRRLTRAADFKRATLGWLLINIYSAVTPGLLLELDLNLHNPNPAWRWDSRAAVLLHGTLALLCCATVVWRQGREFQRVFRILLLAEASLALLLGYGLNAVVHMYHGDPGVLIRLLGVELAGLGLILAVLGNPGAGDDRRRLLLGLGAGNALTAAVTLIELNVWGFDSLWAWGLVLAQAALAVGSVWAGLQPESARSRTTGRQLASRLTWSHLLAGAGAAALGVSAPALSLPSWLALIFAVLLALAIGALFATRLQRELLTTGLSSGGPLPGHEPDEIRQTWLRQVSEAAAQEERNRLARDLHDSIKQQIFSIHVSAAAAQARWESDPDGARTAVADVRRCAQEAMVEMRALLQQLRPRALAGAGLVEALREQCEALGYRSGAEVSLELGEPIPDDRLPPGAQETLFRIAQEALANVARHARARRAHVRLERQGEAALLQVEDDGQGFDPGAKTAGMGLRNLEERAESLGGRLAIASAPGEGARIEVRVPFTPAVTPGAPSLAKAIRNEAREPWVCLMYLALFQFAPDDFLRVFLTASTLFLAGAGWQRVRAALRKAPQASPAEKARLRFLGYRTRVLYLLTAAWFASQISPPYGGSWSWLCRLISLASLLLMAVEMVRAYRESRPRPWPRWVWPSGWERPGCSIAFLIGIACALSVPLSAAGMMLIFRLQPAQISFLALGALTVAYLLWRRPRTEGASS